MSILVCSKETIKILLDKNNIKLVAKFSRFKSNRKCMGNNIKGEIIKKKNYQFR